MASLTPLDLQSVEQVTLSQVTLSQDELEPQSLEWWRSRLQEVKDELNQNEFQVWLKETRARRWKVALVNRVLEMQEQERCRLQFTPSPARAPPYRMPSSPHSVLAAAPVTPQVVPDEASGAPATPVCRVSPASWAIPSLCWHHSHPSEDAPVDASAAKPSEDDTVDPELDNKVRAAHEDNVGQEFDLWWHLIESRFAIPLECERCHGCFSVLKLLINEIHILEERRCALNLHVQQLLQERLNDKTRRMETSSDLVRLC